MRIFLDTNVFVSGFATRGLSADVVRVVMAEHELLTAEVVIDELRRVLSDKFGTPERRVDDIVALLRRHHVESHLSTRPVIEVRDEEDVWVLGSAIEAGAELLVTGYRGLLDIRDRVDALRIVNPREFWNMSRV